MSGWDDGVNYEDDDSEWNEAEDMGRVRCTEFTKEVPWIDDIPRIAPTTFHVSGDLCGDVDWNAIEATVVLRIYKAKDEISLDAIEEYRRRYGMLPHRYTFRADISSFTNNCGIKALHHIHGYNDLSTKKKFLEYLESFLYYCCNCGTIVGSDWIGSDQGSTGSFIREAGVDYVFTEPVWNPNYKGDKNHKVFLFYKHLKAENLVDYWS